MADKERRERELSALFFCVIGFKRSSLRKSGRLPACLVPNFI
jgi:hypothetical protein